MQRHPELLLFDLGGVLVEFSGFRDLRPLLRVPLSESEIRQQWIACPVVRAFEVGTLTPQQFAERFIAAWNIAVSPLDFLQAFRLWTRGFLPGARELLATPQNIRDDDRTVFREQVPSEHVRRAYRHRRT